MIIVGNGVSFNDIDYGTAIEHHLREVLPDQSA